jgi:uncharacterized cupredoxin-like copper-binding protein
MTRTVALWALSLLILFGGCKKKADQSKMDEKRTVSETKEAKVVEKKAVDEGKREEKNSANEVKVSEEKPVEEVKVSENKTVSEIKVDENRPVSEIKAEAEKMAVNQLKAAALKYKAALEAKRVDIEGTLARAKPAGGKMTEEESKALIADIDKVTKSIQALDERYKIYYNKLKELGVNVSELDGKQVMP